MDDKVRRRIYIPSYEYPPMSGGIGRFIDDQICLLSDEGFEVEIDLLPKNLRGWKLWKHLSSRVDKDDLILIHYIFPLATQLYILSFFRNFKYMVFLHGMDWDQANNSFKRSLLMGFILRSAKNVFANSQYLSSEISAKSNLEVLAWQPVLPRDFSLMKEIKEHNHGSELNLLSVSRLVKRKGHEFIIRAIANLDGVKYTIVGDGEYMDYLVNLVNKLGVQDKVVFLGDKLHGDLPDIYLAHDVFVFVPEKSKDDREGFGIVYLEAQWFGLPIIAGKHPETSEAIEENEGFFVDNENGIIEAINKLREVKLRDEKSGVIRDYVARNHLLHHRRDLIKYFYG